MLYREIIALYSELHTKHTNTMCWQNAEIPNFKTGGTQNNPERENGPSMNNQ